MAHGKLVQKNVLLGRDDIIRFQLQTYCFIKGIKLSDADIECLTILAKAGAVKLNDFCYYIQSHHTDIFKTAQSTRNCIDRLSEGGFIVKNGKYRKTIFLDPELQIQSSGTIALHYKFLHREPQEDQKPS